MVVQGEGARADEQAQPLRRPDHDLRTGATCGRELQLSVLGQHGVARIGGVNRSRGADLAPALLGSANCLQAPLDRRSRRRLRCRRSRGRRKRPRRSVPPAELVEIRSDLFLNISSAISCSALNTASSKVSATAGCGIPQAIRAQAANTLTSRPNTKPRCGTMACALLPGGRWRIGPCSSVACASRADADAPHPTSVPSP